MGLIDALKKAEQHGRKAARWGAEHAMVSLDDAERAVRRRMRIYPQQVVGAQSNGARPSAAAPAGAASPAAAAAAPAVDPNVDVPAEDSEIEGRKIA